MILFLIKTITFSYVWGCFRLIGNQRSKYACKLFAEKESPILFRSNFLHLDGLVSVKSLVHIFLLSKVFQPTTVFIRNFQIFLDTYFAYSTLALTLFDDAIFTSGGYCLALLYIFLKLFNRLTLLVKLLVPALIIKQSGFSFYKFSIPSTISLIVALRKFFYGDFL